jgi:hypothetical protein
LEAGTFWKEWRNQSVCHKQHGSTCGMVRVFTTASRMVYGALILLFATLYGIDRVLHSEAHLSRDDLRVAGL